MVQKETISLQPNDTLNIKFVYNDFFSKSIDERDDFRFEQDSTKNEVIFSNNVTLTIKSTDKSSPYIQIEKLAEGKSFSEANQRAEKIKYAFKIVGNQLILDNYLLTEMSSKYRNQNVEIYLYLPVGTYFKADESVQNFDRSDNEFFNLHFGSEDYLYKVESAQVKCLNCPADENEYNDVEKNVSNEDTVVTTTVKVNGEAVIIKESSKQSGRLSTDKNGIIVKNK